jgi:aspartate-semialdehyde dehydrogenase
VLQKKARYNVAVVGATGAVGEEMREILEQRDFPIDEIRLLASERSAGKELEFDGKTVKVRQLTTDSFNGIDIALFSAGGDRSKTFAPHAVAAGAVVVDNSSAFRMDPKVPLVVPEVNPDALLAHNGIIANPNCSTIQMVVPLKPIHDHAGIRRIVVSTYQSVSGSGQSAMDELFKQSGQVLNMAETNPSVYPHQIAFNCLPHIDVFGEDDYTNEEMKLVRETHKIFGDDSIGITATAVRVPVFRAHSESVNLDLIRPLSANEARALMSEMDGVVVYDDPDRDIYPLAIEAGGSDAVYVGRVRPDRTIENGLNMWIVADNLRKGAALNAIQIAERLVLNASA